MLQQRSIIMTLESRQQLRLSVSLGGETASEMAVETQEDCGLVVTRHLVDGRNNSDEILVIRQSRFH